MQTGRGEIAFTLGDALSDAWKGEEDAGFKTPLKGLRTVAGIYPNYIQIVASAESGIKTLADLKGKRISVGAPRSGTELNARAILRAAGLTYKDFAKVEYLPFGESVELIKNRQLDVTLQSAGLGVASIRDLATSLKITVVSIPLEVVSKIGDPAYLPASIPANTYTGQTDAVPTVAIRNFGLQRKRSAETVYAMPKALLTHPDQMATAHLPPSPSPRSMRRRTSRCLCTRAPSAITARRGCSSRPTTMTDLMAQHSLCHFLLRGMLR